MCEKILDEYGKMRIMVIARELIIRTIIVILIIIIGLSYFKNTNERIKTEAIEATVIETVIREEENIFSFLGFVDKYKYYTILNVNGNIIEDKNTEVYYLCRESKNKNILVNVKTLDGEVLEVIGVE